MNWTGQGAGDRDRDGGAGLNERDLRDLEWLAGLMDDRFRIPGTKVRFGLDSLLGLGPVALG